MVNRKSKHGEAKPSRTYAKASTERGRASNTNSADYTPEELEFMEAMDRFKSEHQHPFPSWSEVLEVVRGLGYRKVSDPSPEPSPASE